MYVCEESNICVIFVVSLLQLNQLFFTLGKLLEE